MSDQGEPYDGQQGEPYDDGVLTDEQVEAAVAQVAAWQRDHRDESVMDLAEEFQDVVVRDDQGKAFAEEAQRRAPSSALRGSRATRGFSGAWRLRRTWTRRKQQTGRCRRRRTSSAM